MIYKLRDKFPNFLLKLIPKFIRKKIDKKFFKLYFIPTNHSKLLPGNYINRNSYDYQKNLISNFGNNLKQNSSMSCPHLIELLLMKYNNEDEIVFLDIGADNIDFFLELNKNFKNVKYFFHNLKSVNKIFKKLKFENNFDNFFVVDQIDDVFNQQFDFINFGSSIEYFDNYDLILEKSSNSGKNIFFSGTTLYETKNEKYKRHMVVKQVNLFPDTNYLYFFNKQYFFSKFLNNNFKLLFEKKNLTDNVYYKNIKNYFDNINYTDFLFTKIE